jgi:hypothetical protein
MPTSILLLSLLLTGCASTASTDPTGTPSAPAATDRPTPDTTPTTTTTPESAGELIVTLDAVEYRQDGRTEVLAFDQPGPLVALIEQLTGQPAVRKDIEDPWGNGDVYGTDFTWTSVSISSFDQGPMWVTFLSPMVGDANLKTAEGIAVGSTLDEVIAAGGWGEWDGDGDGLADSINLGMREVPETNSLSRPGEVGAEFIDLSLSGDTVDRISSPSNDFSDL